MMDWFLVWWLRSARYRWSKFRRNLFERRYLATPLPVVQSLAEIEACLRQVTWTLDGFLHLYDSISYPETVWQRKRDDCDGFSVLAATLLRAHVAGSYPVLVTALVRPVSSSHTVCAFHAPGGALRYFDNENLRPNAFEDYETIVKEISGGARRLVCWDVRDPVTFSLIEFHKV